MWCKPGAGVTGGAAAAQGPNAFPPHGTTSGHSHAVPRLHLKIGISVFPFIPFLPQNLMPGHLVYTYL